MEKVNLAEKFGLFDEYWSPKIVGELNLLFEPKSALNTGNVRNERTVENLKWI